MSARGLLGKSASKTRLVCKLSRTAGLMRLMKFDRCPMLAVKADLLPPSETCLKRVGNAHVLADQRDTFVAFIFDADHVSFAKSGVDDYGTPCEDAFLQALAASDEARECCSQVRRGDVLARNLALRLKRFVRVEEARQKERSALSESRHYGVDPRALAVVVGDLADSLNSLWCSVDLAELPHRLTATNVYCLAVFPMRLSLVKRIDERLRSYQPYVGAVELDAGNPIHVRLFSHLLECIYFSGRKMCVSRWWTGEGVHEFGSDPTRCFDLVELPYDDFQRTAPPFPTVNTLSDRGAASARRLAEVTRASHFEKVANELAHAARGRSDQRAVDVRVVLPDDQQLDVPVTKLLGYSLNADHPSGRHKARLFSELLGIDAKHWRYLAYQLVDGLAQAQLDRTRVTDHGVQYGALIQVAGLNRKTCTVETAWIIRESGPAQLVTAFPAVRAKQQKGVAASLPWVPEEASERWLAIYTAACERATQAAEACVPTPMQIDGFGIELEGLCGGASVRLDGRGAFARWLTSQGYAYKRYGRGVSVPAHVKSQSADRAEAYAKAFSRVLWLNGIDGAVVESYLS